MTAKTIILLILSVASVAFCASAPAEPNDAVAELKFEKSPLAPTWTVSAAVDGELVTYYNPGSVRPEYAAKITLPRDRIFSSDVVMQMVMRSPLAQKLSPGQSEFLTQGFGVSVDTTAANVPNHYSVNLYAVSEEDARIMAHALIDTFATNAGMAVASEREELEQCQERLKQNQAALPEKERQLEDMRKQYEATKSSTYPLSSEYEARKLAEELVLQMDRQAKTLDIELAGVRGKLKVIDEYLGKPNLDNNVIETLEAQRIEQTIELSGLEARREAIHRIRDEQRRFCRLLEIVNDLERSVGQMKNTITRDQEIITGITNRLANPSGYMVPPKIYQNKVILHPIAPEDAQNRL